MAEFLVEEYVSRTDAASVERAARRAHEAAAEMTRDGTPIAYLRSIFAPEEETCFYLYEAGSAEVVREAARRAGIDAGNVVAALISPIGGER